MTDSEREAAARNEYNPSVDLRARNSSMFDLTRLFVHIIGCGAIGSFTASTLARMGVTSFDLLDPDIVAPENIGVQDFTYHQLGEYKVAAVKQNILSLNPNADVRMSRLKMTSESRHCFHAVYDNDYWLRYSSRGSFRKWQHVFIIAVDSMESRLQIVQHEMLGERYKNCLNPTAIKPSYIYDARMGSETFQFYKFPLPLVQKDYMKTWYSDEEGDSDACSARATAYCSTLAGSLIASEIKKNENGNLGAENIVFNFPSLLLNAEVNYSSLIKK